MQIFWHGYSCVRIESSSHEKDATLVTDPFASEAGLRFPRTLAPDILTLSHQNRKQFPDDAFENKPFIISDPGEYEIKGLFVYGIAVPNADGSHPHGIMYRYEIEGMSVAFLGGLSRALSEEEAGTLEHIDILLLPVGGGQSLNAKQARELVALIEPRIVVPIHYHIDGIKEALAPIDAFCKELGSSKRQDANKLKLSKKDLPADDMQLIVLERT